MKRWALTIDVQKCTNCQNCVLATRDEHSGNDFPGYNTPISETGADWINVERRVRGNDSMVDVTYVPRTCNHCDDAPCVRAAGSEAIYQRRDGIVMIDPVKSRGRRDLVASCPYGVIYWNEGAQAPQKWSFDAHLLDAGWRAPRCVQACPTGALQSSRLTDDEFEERKAAEALQELRPELKTRPRVLYKNLDHASRVFLGGNVTRACADGCVENVPAARVELLLSGKQVAGCSTDSFGDFKFDNLSPNQGFWTIRASHPDHGVAQATGALAQSRYIGSLLLTTSAALTGERCDG